MIIATKNPEHAATCTGNLPTEMGDKMLQSLKKNINRLIIDAEVVLMTPEMSRELLQFNTHNRDLRQSTVQLYAAQMRRHEWQMNGEPIIIADNNDVMDGQHRLWSCIKSNTPFMTLIVRGVPRDTFATIDTGRARNGADVLRIEGLRPEIARTCGTASGLCIGFEVSGNPNFWGKHAHAVTPARRAEWVNRNPRIKTIAETVASFGRKAKHLSAGQTTFLWYYMEKKSPECTEDFFTGFLTGANLGEKDPRLALRQKIELQSAKRQKWAYQDKMGAVIRAWDWYRKGRKVKDVRNLFRNLPEAFSLIKL